MQNTQNTQKHFDDTDLKAMLNGYLDCALWADMPEGEGEGLTIYDIHVLCLEDAKKDCALFLELVQPILPPDVDFSLLGHDFWLARNHGSGFLDRETYGKQARILSGLALSFREQCVLVHENTIFIE